jgi:hypothetical protein
MSSKDVQPKRSADDFKTGVGEFAHADGEVRGAPSRDRLSCAVSLTIVREQVQRPVRTNGGRPNPLA